MTVGKNSSPGVWCSPDGQNHHQSLLLFPFMANESVVCLLFVVRCALLMLMSMLLWRGEIKKGPSGNNSGGEMDGSEGAHRNGEKGKAG